MSPLTGWEIEARIKAELEHAPSGQSFCALCFAERWGMTSAHEYLEIANALRRVGTYTPQRYATEQGKCVSHTGPSGAGTLWLIRTR